MSPFFGGPLPSQKINDNIIFGGVKNGREGKGLLFRYYDLFKHPMNINLIEGLILG